MSNCGIGATLFILRNFFGTSNVTVHLHNFEMVHRKTKIKSGSHPVTLNLNVLFNTSMELTQTKRSSLNRKLPNECKGICT